MILRFRFIGLFLMMCCCVSAQEAPTPLLRSGEPVNWWFVFKFNAESFPGCGGAQRTCSFGGAVKRYWSFSQQFVFASSADRTLQPGGGCIGDTTMDPLGRHFRGSLQRYALLRSLERSILRRSAAQ